jgi:FkbH-like protein
MILKVSDIACFEASWDPKPVAMERIGKSLRLGLDSFVFFDDNPAEREIVMQMLPEVEVVDVPVDPAGYVRALYGGLCFESAGMTEADRMRAEQYREEQERAKLEQSAGSLEEYLASLQMVADVRKLDEADMERAVQLLGKTNQFNLTTRRHGAETVRRMAGNPRAVCLTLRLADRFGDAGLVKLVMGVPMEGEGGEEGEEARTLRLDTWLMSCRVIARTVEESIGPHSGSYTRESAYVYLRPPVQVDGGKDVIVGFHFGQLHFLQWRYSVAGGDVLGDVDRAIKSRGMARESLDGVIGGRTVLDNKRPVAGLQQ